MVLRPSGPGSGVLPIKLPHPYPCSLNPAKYTAYTIHPAPYSIRHTVYSVHPPPCNLHHTPSTLHYTPYTLHHAPRVYLGPSTWGAKARIWPWLAYRVPNRNAFILFEPTSLESQGRNPTLTAILCSKSLGCGRQIGTSTEREHLARFEGRLSKSKARI